MRVDIVNSMWYAFFKAEMMAWHGCIPPELIILDAPNYVNENGRACGHDNADDVCG